MKTSVNSRNNKTVYYKLIYNISYRKAFIELAEISPDVVYKNMKEELMVTMMQVSNIPLKLK